MWSHKRHHEIKAEELIAGPLHYSIWVGSKIFCIPMPSLKSSTGDTKAGTLIGTDRYGNKYFENLQDELPRSPLPLPIPPSYRLTTTTQYEHAG